MTLISRRTGEDRARRSATSRPCAGRLGMGLPWLTAGLLVAGSACRSAGGVAQTGSGGRATPASRPETLPGLPVSCSDDVAVIPYHVNPKFGENIFIPAEVDGHQGVFEIDTGSPLIFLNSQYLHVNPRGGLDTLPLSKPSSFGNGNFVGVQVHTLRLGTLQCQLPHGPVNFTGFGVTTASNAAIIDEIADRGYDGILGFLGLPALAPFETIIDYVHQRLILIRLDAAGRRVVPVPAYTPMGSAPLVVSTDRQHFGVRVQVGGTSDVFMLDTGSPQNTVVETTQQQWQAHLTPIAGTVIKTWAVDTLRLGQQTYAHEMFEPAWMFFQNTLGVPFLQSLGTVGFNFRTRQLLLYP